MADPRGQFSASLLRPLHPLHDDLAAFAGWKFVTILLWLPIAAVLWIAFDPVLDPTLLEVGVFSVAIWGAYLIRTMFMSVARDDHVLDDAGERDLRALRSRASCCSRAGSCRCS